MKPNHQVQYWRDPDLPGVEVARVKQSQHVFPNHAHDDVYAISLMEAGASYCLGPDHENSLVAPGSVALINPGQVHSGAPASRTGATYRMLYVTLARMAEMAAEINDGRADLPEFRHLVIDDPFVAQRLNRSFLAFGTTEASMERESALVEAISLLLATCGGIHHAPPLENRKAVFMAKEILSENLSEKLSLADVAGTVGLSRYHFLRVFKQATGLSPHTFRTQRRIDQAKILLKTDLPFTDVAFSVGFSDQSHFTNKFRQFTAATPKQYRRSVMDAIR